MKKKIYDLSRLEKVTKGWYKPSELSTMLKDAALNLAILIKDAPEEISDMQIAIANATMLLDAIEGKEVEL